MRANRQRGDWSNPSLRQTKQASQPRETYDVRRYFGPNKRRPLLLPGTPTLCHRLRTILLFSLHILHVPPVVSSCPLLPPSQVYSVASPRLFSSCSPVFREMHGIGSPSLTPPLTARISTLVYLVIPESAQPSDTTSRMLLGASSTACSPVLTLLSPPVS